MKSLVSIDKVIKVYETFGSKPVLVTCNDLNDWVCKYDSPKSLLNELLASEFAKLWEINVPESASVKIKQEHLKDTNLIFQDFDKECFATKYLTNVVDVNDALVPLIKSNKNLIHNKEDLLKIALFDIWLANDDRTLNNNNLLLQYGEKGMNVIYAIDHICIFNSSFLDRKIYDLNEDDTIMSSEIYKILFGKNKNLLENVDTLLNNFYIYVSECNKKLEEILGKIPKSWKINKEEYTLKLKENVFKEDWNTLCIKNFKEFIQTLIIK